MKKRLKPISLYPMKLEEALKAALSTAAPAKRKRPGITAQKKKRKP